MGVWKFRTSCRIRNSASERASLVPTLLSGVNTFTMSKVASGMLARPSDSFHVL